MVRLEELPESGISDETIAEIFRERPVDEMTANDVWVLKRLAEKLGCQP